MTSNQHISDFIQNELRRRGLPSVHAVEAARWLDTAGVLKDSGSRPGKPLRNLLRARQIIGQRQNMNSRWFIDRLTDAMAPPFSPHTVMPDAGKVRIREEGGIREGAARTDFAEARRKYRPSHVRILLVAEAPPKADSGRFFYFDHVPRGDSLFWETMKVLYPQDMPPSGVPRASKRKFLQRFMADGFFLLDAVDEPIEADTQAGKRQRIREALPRLMADLRETCQRETKVILISAPVYDVCASALKADGVDVINEAMIDFPGSGCQRKFRVKLRLALRKVCEAPAK